MPKITSATAVSVKRLRRKAEMAGVELPSANEDPRAGVRCHLFFAASLPPSARQTLMVRAQLF